MTAQAFDWDEELSPETETEVYQALLRALKRKQGFGLFFVQCSKAQGTKVVASLKRDLPQYRVKELHLQEEVTTLYDQVSDLWEQQSFEVLVIDGLEASLYAYEDMKRFSGWSSEEIYNYSWKGVPKILNHLNQQRERFQHDFPTRFVFLMPPFAMDYFIQRAADFLDWRSGLFRFPRDLRNVVQEADRLIATGSYTKYQTLAPQERVEKILDLKSLQETCSDSDLRAKLLSELGLLFVAGQDYENAVVSWEKAVELIPDYHQAWYNRGVALAVLGRNKEAVNSYDHALQFQPGNHDTWNNRGNALADLGQYEEAISSYNQALQIKPDDHQALNNWGVSLAALGQHKEAINRFNQALQIKPDYCEAGHNRQVTLDTLKYHDQAIEAITLIGTRPSNSSHSQSFLSNSKK